MSDGLSRFTRRCLASISICSTCLLGQVSIGGLKLILSGPGASGSRAMPDGRQQEPGGWNRVLLQVQDLPARIAELKEAGLRFRNEMEVGVGSKQIQIEDPDGNPIELFEPARH
jgi:glyoxylase I family protein